MADHESAIICDLAQYYNIYDWRKFEIGYIATLVCGLGSDSRTMLEIADTPFSINTYIQAITADYLANLLFVEIKKSVGKKKQVEKPKSLLDILKNAKNKDDAQKELRTYRTPEEFEQARREIIEKG